MAKSVGSLYVDILARVDTLEKDLAKARKMINDTDKGIRKAGDGAKAAYESFSLFNSFKGRGMLGIVTDMTALSMAFKAAKQEIMFVYQNIDKIPGIPATAVASVNEFKVNLHDAQNILHRIVAIGMGGVFDFGKMVGVGFASAMGYDDGDLEAKLESLDKIKEANDPTYWDRVREGQVKLSEARKKETVATEMQAGRITELRKQAEQYETFAKSNSISTLARIEAQTQASNKRKEANAIEVDLENKYRTTSRNYIVEVQRDNMMEMTQLERIVAYRKEIAMLGKQMIISRGPGESLDLKPEEIERINLVMPQWIINMKSLRDELHKIKTPAQEFRDTFVNAFSQVDDYLVSFMTNGKLKFNDFLLELSNSILKTFVKLAIINPLINAIFGGGAGGALLPALFGAGATKGKADGGMGSGWTLVGERGPELANLGSGSFVLPAGETSRKLGSGGGNTYVIDARGADAGVAERIQQMLLALAGPGVVEQRALSALQNNRARRQGA